MTGPEHLMEPPPSDLVGWRLARIEVAVEKLVEVHAILARQDEHLTRHDIELRDLKLAAGRAPVWPSVVAAFVAAAALAVSLVAR